MQSHEVIRKTHIVPVQMGMQGMGDRRQDGRLGDTRRIGASPEASYLYHVRDVVVVHRPPSLSRQHPLWPSQTTMVCRLSASHIWPLARPEGQ